MGQQTLYVMEGVGFNSINQAGVLVPGIGSLPAVGSSIEASDNCGHHTWFHCRRTAIPDIIRYYSGTKTFIPYGRIVEVYGTGAYREDHNVIIGYGTKSIGISSNVYQGRSLGCNAYMIDNPIYVGWRYGSPCCEARISHIDLPDVHATTSEDLTQALLAIDWAKAQSWVAERTVLPVSGNYYYPDFSSLDFNFKYNELGTWDLYSFLKRDADIDILPPLYSQGCGAAYINMIADLPETQINTFANVVETAGLVKAGLDLLLKHDVRSFCQDLRRSKKPKNLWLKYRYQYLTTSGDVREYADLTSRLCELATAQSEMVECRGTYRRGELLFRCSAKFQARPLIPESSADWLSTYGYKLSAVNAWDMVPYSFVVDWFLHVSDIIDYFESYGNGLKYHPTDMWYSIETSYDAQTVYMRFPSRTRFIPATTWNKPTSKRTLFMRLTDVLALFF